MTKESFQENDSLTEQLEKYAKDLSAVCKSEKEKRKQVELTTQQLLQYAQDLNKNLQELKASHQELNEAYLDTIRRLVLAAEYKDEDTGAHIARMSRYSALIAEKLGLPAEEVQNIQYAAPMHDVGKIGIPDSILMKPGKLTDEEFETIKTHSNIGGKILTNSKAEVLKVAEQIALSVALWSPAFYFLALSKCEDRDGKEVQKTCSGAGSKRSG